MTDQEKFDVITEVRLMKRDLKYFSEKVTEHIEQGNKWRLAIIGIIFAGVVQILSFSIIWGQVTTKVIRNEKDLDRIICALSHYEVGSIER